MRRLKLPGKLGWCAAQSLVAVVLAVMAAPWWLTAAACILMLYVQLVLWLTLSHDMALVARSMQQTTQGDLTVHASLQGHDEMAEMARSLDQMVYKLSAMVADIRSNAALVAHAGQSLAHGNRALADRTEQQAANLEETAASVEELSSTVQNNAHTALSADQKAAQVRQAADTGAQAMARAVQSVEAIQQGARRMSEIIGVIDGIAFKPISWRSMPQSRRPGRVSKAGVCRGGVRGSHAGAAFRRGGARDSRSDPDVGGAGRIQCQPDPLCRRWHFGDGRGHPQRGRQHERDRQLQQRAEHGPQRNQRRGAAA